MIKNILWDMGNVLADFNVNHILERMPVKKEHKDILRKEVFDSVEWILFDGGAITPEDFVTTIQGRVDPSLWPEVELAILHWFDYTMEPIKETEILAQKLKAAGYHQYVLSNANVLFDAYKDRIPAFQLMDGLFVSAFYKMLKPEARIYDELAKTYGLNPEECVFIDDNRVNVAGAIIQNMKGIVFTGDIKQLEQDLAKLGVTW